MNNKWPYVILIQRSCLAVENNIYYYIGQQIAATRKRLGLKQSDLAQMVGMTPSTVSHWEIASVQIPVNMLCAVASALNVSVLALLPREAWAPHSLEIGLDGHMASVLAAYQSDEKIRWAIDALIRGANT